MNENLKYLTEVRAEKLEAMNKLLEAAKLEKRAMTEDELKNFEENKKEIENADATILAEEIAREKMAENLEKEEIRAFLDYVKNPVQNRANFTAGDNGALVPTTISKQIIQAVQDICPIYNLAQVFNVKGELRIPYYGDKNGKNITCGYAQEFTELTASAGKFTATTLNGFTAGVLTLISKSLIYKSGEAGFNVVSFIVSEIAKKVAIFLEKEFLLGTGTNACQGILKGATNVINTGIAGQIRPDDLISLQESVPDMYQPGAVWIMNRSTRAAIRKFKDSTGNYLLNPDLTAKWGYTLLGKPVYTSDNMPGMDEGEKAIIYGDMTGLSAKFAKSFEMQVLNEHYATQHAVGICGWLEIDSKVTDQQKIAVLQVAETQANP